MSNPCYKCQHRQVGCHDACPGYLKFKEENEAMKKAMRRERTKDDYGRRLWR